MIGPFYVQLSTRLIPLTAALALAAVHLSVWSQETLTPRLRAAQPGITSATLVLLPEATPYPGTMHEKDLKRVGCTMFFTDRKMLDDLVELLAQADVKMVGAVSDDDLRLSVELRSADGAVIKLLFTDTLRKEDGLVHGTVSGQHVTAAPGFPNALRSWFEARLGAIPAPKLRTCAWRAFLPPSRDQVALDPAQLALSSAQAKAALVWPDSGPMVLSGRLGANYDEKGFPTTMSRMFKWSQTARAVDAVLSLPGEATTTIRLTPESATLTQSDAGAPLVAREIGSLTKKTLGWTLPAVAMRDWLQGYATAADGTRFVASPSNKTVVTADGWRVEFVNWLDTTVARPLPRRIQVSSENPALGPMGLIIFIDTRD